VCGGVPVGEAALGRGFPSARLAAVRAITRPPPPTAATPVAAPPTKGLAERLWDRFRPYKEIAVALGSLFIAALAVHDYFATRDQVLVLTCRSNAQLDELRLKMEVTQIGNEIMERSCSASPVNPKVMAPADLSAAMRCSSLWERRQRADREADAARKLYTTHECEALVREGKVK
jgi:hypothetical protein